ncbi:winged helix-turn-helix transcriptional regulator [Leeuwenhoekiella polynyae]|uniref:HxlR family transcriptional regulator n=1 Tax=Leeuwenhoekiella polynyae TaxID=1550906 RepID=A0A4V1KRW2_9FLAO|nr:winged helix-turn-helix transcriptional regulator [Leeuwenhoekiella polynyae]RXG26304.1 HxlR family transcriptional regulator [Leeuwenhoekiella polynyae]
MVKQEQNTICNIKNQTEIKYAQDTLYVLNGKWRLLVFIAIYNGNHRYRQIAKNVPNITFAMLSKELKLMELNKLILRSEDPDFPKDVMYTLTPYSESLYPLVEHMIAWGKEHRDHIK